MHLVSISIHRILIVFTGLLFEVQHRLNVYTFLCLIAHKKKKCHVSMSFLKDDFLVCAKDINEVRKIIKLSFSFSGENENKSNFYQ